MTPDAVKASYRRMIDLVGQPILIRRYAGAGAARPTWEVRVKARTVGFDAQELAGAAQQADKRIILLADDLLGQQLELPLRKDDKAVIRGKEFNIEDPDQDSRRIAGVLVAYELRVRG